MIKFTCIPPKNEKDPRLCLLLAEEPFDPSGVPFFADNLDRIAPDMIEPNLMDKEIF